MGAMPRIGLVLGAGGVVGHAFHAGVLAELAASTGWDPRDAEVVVGTSAGSVVGALLRAGVSPADIAARATGEALSPEGARLAARADSAGPRPSIPRRAPRRAGRVPRMASPGTFVRAAFPPIGFVRPGALAAAALPTGQVPTELIAAGFRPLFTAGWPDRELWLCAVRLDSGRRVVFGRDDTRDGVDVADAVAASCAIPAFFEPVTIGGVRYVDGGAHSPTNADLAADGPGLVLVSSPMSVGRGALRPRAELVGRLTHRASLQREVAGLRRRGRTVVTFQPGSEDIAVMGGGASALDAGRRDRVARQARESTLRRLGSPRLREVLAALR
jgi:NTE family protein